MKLTVFETFCMARIHLSKVSPNMGKNARLVFSLDDKENDQIIAALANGMGNRNLVAMKLVHFGMADNYDEARKMIDKAIYPKSD